MRTQYLTTLIMYDTYCWYDAVDELSNSSVYSAMDPLISMTDKVALNLRNAVKTKTQTLFKCS